MHIKFKFCLVTIVIFVTLCKSALPARADDDPLQLGIKLLNSDQNCKAAIIQFTKVIGRQPRLADAYAYRATAENACKRYPQALVDANMALKLDSAVCWV